MTFYQGRGEKERRIFTWFNDINGITGIKKKTEKAVFVVRVATEFRHGRYTYLAT